MNTEVEKKSGIEIHYDINGNVTQIVSYTPYFKDDHITSTYKAKDISQGVFSVHHKIPHNSTVPTDYTINLADLPKAFQLIFNAGTKEQVRTLIKNGSITNCVEKTPEEEIFATK